MACDPQTLLTQAGCFECLPPGQLELVKLALLCKIATGGELTSVASFNRPNDSTSYSISDSVSTLSGTVLVFPGMAQSAGGGGIIREVKYATDLAGWSSALQLYLFTKPPTPTADNFPLIMSLADNLNWELRLNLGGPSAEAAGSTVFASFNAFTAGYVCDAADTALYGLLGFNGAGNTPGPNQFFQITLTADVI
jgi:hypothetical protein